MRRILSILELLVGVLVLVASLWGGECPPLRYSMVGETLVGCDLVFKRVDWSVIFPDGANVTGISQGNGKCDTIWDCPPFNATRTRECWPQFDTPTTGPGYWQQNVRNQTTSCVVLPCQTGGDQRGCGCFDDGAPVTWRITHTCPPIDDDHDGYIADYDGGNDCNDNRADVNPGVYEGPGSGGQADCALCYDSIDNDCDGSIDGQDSDCAALCGNTPIVIDTQGDDFALVGLDAGVQFDFFGNGEPIRLGWIQGNDALLVLDRNGNGLIDSGLELFGNHTRLKSGQRALNGYQALAEFDVNGDFLIDGRDPIFSELRLWLDRNVNGVTDAGELSTLAGHDISALELGYIESRRRDQYGNEFRYRAKVHGSRQTTNRFCYDVIFVMQTIVSELGRKVPTEK